MRRRGRQRGTKVETKVVDAFIVEDAFMAAVGVLGKAKRDGQ